MKYIRTLFICLSVSLALSALETVHAQTKSIEVLHWWTSGGEAKALDVLKQDMAQRGYSWKDSSIIGGDQQRLVLRARINAQNPPDAMLIQGNVVRDYFEDGLLTNLDNIATKEDWGKTLPIPLQKIVKNKGHWAAVPVNIHRSHWVWANKKIFDQLHLTPPKTFEEMVSAADKIRKAGYIPLAHGGQAWQDLILFDSAVLSVGGPTFYKQALIDLDPKALGGKTMQKAFEQLAKLRGMLDKNFIGRDWNLATAMVIHDKAAMQIMGDWVKGEFLKYGKKPNVDFLCFTYPGTEGSFIFIPDLFGMFNVPQKQLTAQHTLASVLMEKGFQEKFNLVKGSIPARMDISMDNFDDCGKQSALDFKLALKNNTAIHRFDTTIPNKARSIIFTVVSNFLETGDKSPAEATQQLEQCMTKRSNKNEGFITLSYEGCSKQPGL